MRGGIELKTWDDIDDIEMPFACMNLTLKEIPDPLIIRCWRNPEIIPHIYGEMENLIEKDEKFYLFICKTPFRHLYGYAILPEDLTDDVPQMVEMTFLEMKKEFLRRIKERIKEEKRKCKKHLTN